jgi:hypothetical protein
MKCLESGGWWGATGLLRVETLGLRATTVGGLRLTVASSGSNALKGDE